MPSYTVQICEVREQSFLNSASREVSILGQSLETDSDIVQNCVTLFRVEHTWLGYRLSHDLTKGSSVGVNSDVLFTTYQAYANHQPPYRMHILEDVGNLPFVKRQQFAASQLSRKEVRPNFEHEQQERSGVYLKRRRF